MKRLLLSIVILLFTGCASISVEKVIGSQGGILEVDGARIEIPAGGLSESTLVKVEKKSISQRTYEQGFNLMGTSYVISPETLFFEKPMQLSFPVMTQNIALGAKIGSGFVPVAGSVIEGETLRATIWHGGEYYVITEPDEYGIRDHSDTEEGLLIVSDIYVSDYIKKFKQVMRQGGYQYPIWTFVYPSEKSLEENAHFLAEELNKLHEEYGDFRLDMVNFGVGGLLANAYLADTNLYQKDVSSAFITVGTPFHGSNFVDLDSVRKGRSPYRFFFVDGLGDNMMDLQSESEFFLWIKKSRLGKHYYDCPEEAQNSASIRGRSPFKGEFPEEYKGDGLVSVEATYLTPLEPVPFPLSHFELYENKEVHAMIKECVQLYRTFTWPLVFSRVWKGEEAFSKILELWEKEKKLHYHNHYIGLEQLLELNENMLKSAPKDAILITNGDNDTYPAWYVQEKKGIRKDVLIVNRNLLNLKEHVMFLQKKGLALDIGEEELDRIKHKKEDGEVITKSDQLIKMLVEQKKRPVVFSTTVYRPDRFGYPLKLAGLVYEIDEGDVEVNEKYVDVTKTKHLFHNVFSFEKLLSVPFDSLDDDMQALSTNYAACAFTLSVALKKQDKHKEALQEMQFAIRLAPEKHKHHFYFNEASMYLELEKREKADSIFKKVLEMPGADSKFKTEIARKYYEEMDMKEEAIKILADCLKDNPDDKEILELIQEYQEGL